MKDLAIDIDDRPGSMAALVASNNRVVIGADDLDKARAALG